VFYKESLHLRRDSMALFAALIIPIIQLVILGAAVDTNVRQVRTAVYDETGVMERAGGSHGSETSRALLDRFRNSDTFHIYRFVHSDDELTQELVAGHAKVGIKIPLDFDRQLLRGESGQVLVLVDGSDSSVAGQAVNVVTAIGLDESLQRALASGAVARGLGVPAVDVRPKVMFNPDSRSPNFFLPGMMPVLLLFVTTLLTAFSIVREKERGTLEQLLITPVRPLGLMMGKLSPYFVVGLTEMSLILLLMRTVFRVPIHGNLLLLYALAPAYMFVNLAVGLLISTRARTQVEALQVSMGLIMPSIFLSGYIFPRETMPGFFYWLSYLLPATYMMDISRGIILRGATLAQLWPNAVALTILGTLVMLIAARNFRKLAM
jgi:ABC-2 type transport system permease protein